MVKDKEWLKEEIRKISKQNVFLTVEEIIKGPKVLSGSVLKLIDQLEEPKKVVIPRFVADWIEETKDNTLEESLTSSYGDVFDWLYNNEKMIQREAVNNFAHAWLNGYEVEKEKLYTTCFETKKCLIPRGLFLYKSKGRIYVGDNVAEFYKDNERCHLTEKEIKDYDERFWKFAEEVPK